MYRLVTVLLAVLFLPAALVVTRGRRAHERASEWALGIRYPAEDLTGLTPATGAAFARARCAALWQNGVLIGLTSGHRPHAEQLALFEQAVTRHGSVAAARAWVLPPGESAHVAGTALDIRPSEGAKWLERNGDRFGLYRTYANEWWHFEHFGAGRRPRLRANPGSTGTESAQQAGV
ncbi:hypothetical protein GCM10010174_74760 [Kutzneria viridogrisea]|uniref:D-alanyl-D-alanine carboxypeptidase-like core domain-containing protein n=1 Tax=Kutzneria albida DSM 43870 TaxID=1449976 RepID=W5W6Y3_9PSEU|nr:hypothetical protein KALB_3153 [Kutzneria albida DSM 43870]